MTDKEAKAHRRLILKVMALETEAGKTGCHIFITALNDCKNKLGWRLAEALHGGVGDKRL